MAWVSPKVYAILSSSEEGKDIIERLPDMTQDECSKELDAFFGEGGKGFSSGNDYNQAKIDDETEERLYKEQGDKEVSEEDLEDDEGEDTKIVDINDNDDGEDTKLVSKIYHSVTNDEDFSEDYIKEQIKGMNKEEAFSTMTRLGIDENDAKEIWDKIVSENGYDTINWSNDFSKLKKGKVYLKDNRVGDFIEFDSVDKAKNALYNMLSDEDVDSFLEKGIFNIATFNGLDDDGAAHFSEVPTKEYRKKPTYQDLVRFSNDDSPEYNLAKEFITTKGGRGLAKALSRPDEDLSEKGLEVKNAIIKSAKPSTRFFALYRTDDTEWLKGTKVGDAHPMDLFIGASMDKDMVIPENLNKVKQKMKINVKTGDPILAVNNANEQEVDIVRTNPNYGLLITGIEEEDGVPVYEVEMYR